MLKKHLLLIPILMLTVSCNWLKVETQTEIKTNGEVDRSVTIETTRQEDLSFFHEDPDNIFINKTVDSYEQKSEDGKESKTIHRKKFTTAFEAGDMQFESFIFKSDEMEEVQKESPSSKNITEISHRDLILGKLYKYKDTITNDVNYDDYIKEIKTRHELVKKFCINFVHVLAKDQKYDVAKIEKYLDGFLLQNALQLADDYYKNKGPEDIGKYILKLLINEVGPEELAKRGIAEDKGSEIFELLLEKKLNELVFTKEKKFSVNDYKNDNSLEKMQDVALMMMVLDKDKEPTPEEIKEIEKASKEDQKQWDVRKKEIAYEVFLIVRSKMDPFCVQYNDLGINTSYNFNFSVNMPGTIIDHNGEIKDGKPTWSITPYDIFPKGFTAQATSFAVNKEVLESLLGELSGEDANKIGKEFASLIQKISDKNQEKLLNAIAKSIEKADIEYFKKEIDDLKDFPHDQIAAYPIYVLLIKGVKAIKPVIKIPKNIKKEPEAPELPILDIKKRVSTTRSNLKALKQAVEEYRIETGKFPSKDLSELTTEILNNGKPALPKIPKEYITSQTGSNKIHLEINNQGGWYFDPDLGQIKVNYNKRLDDEFEKFKGEIPYWW